MFGPRLGNVFSSRWKALWWAASILLLAWRAVPAPDEQATDTPHAHVDPWAKVKKDSAN